MRGKLKRVRVMRADRPVSFRAAQSLAGSQKRAALEKTQRFLVAELSDVGANDQLSARKLQQLLGQVRRELGQ